MTSLSSKPTNIPYIFHETSKLIVTLELLYFIFSVIYTNATFYQYQYSVAVIYLRNKA